MKIAPKTLLYPIRIKLFEFKCFKNSQVHVHQSCVTLYTGHISRLVVYWIFVRMFYLSFQCSSVSTFSTLFQMFNYSMYKCKWQYRSLHPVAIIRHYLPNPCNDRWIVGGSTKGRLAAVLQSHLKQGFSSSGNFDLSSGANGKPKLWYHMPQKSCNFPDGFYTFHCVIFRASLSCGDIGNLSCFGNRCRLRLLYSAHLFTVRETLCSSCYWVAESSLFCCCVWCIQGLAVNRCYRISRGNASIGTPPLPASVRRKLRTPLVRHVRSY